MKEVELPNPHDQFVRATFSRPEIARDFLANYLPPEIVAKLDLDSLELTQESFVDEDLRPHHTDLLYKINLKSNRAAFIYILLEHKSSPDKWIAFQLLRYIVRIWEKSLREKAAKLPPIIPLVLYHGAAKWKISREFAATVKDAKDFGAYTPNFVYELCNVSASAAENIKGAVLSRFVLLALREVFAANEEKLNEILTLLRDAAGKDALELLRIFLRYYSAANNTISAEDVKQGLKKAFPEKEGEIMGTMAQDWIKQGMQQGLEQGLQQGRQEGEAAFALRHLQKRFGNLGRGVEKQIRALPLDKLEDLSEALLDFQDLPALKNWLKENASSAREN